MRARSSESSLLLGALLRRWTMLCTSGLLLAIYPGVVQAQTVGGLGQSPQTPADPATTASPAAPAPSAGQAKPVRNVDRRRAAKLYLASSKLFEKEQFEEAMQGYEQAAKLDPGNADYQLAAALARTHAVTALIQTAAKDRLRGDTAGARAALARALELEPKNPQLSVHLSELGDDALLGESRPLYEEGAATAGAADAFVFAPGVHSFHMRNDARQVIQQVFKAYGVEATVDDSVRTSQVRLDLDDASFDVAVRTVAMVTTTFFVPLDAHRVLVARDTRELRQQFIRQQLETIYLSGLSSTELTDVANLAKNVFDIQQAVAEPTDGTITIRAPEKTMNAFNATMRDLISGRNQVLLEVRLIQIAHVAGRNTGAQLPQQLTAFNVYAEEQAILNANAALVQQIISSGLAAPGDTLAIIAILIASGQVSSSLFSGGFALFGGGLTQSALAPGSATLKLALNSADSRQLDQIQLRLGDGEAGTLRTGTRYPIQTSSFSSLSGSLPNIPGLTGAGNSGGLGALIGELGGGIPNVPQVEYQDLGLTLKATPKVMRNNLVALTIDLKINALSGSSINGNPVLNNRAYSGVVTLKQGEAIVVVSELDKEESRAVSGTPGVSEIPGLNNITSKDVEKNYATLLIVISPHVIRGTQEAGHSPVMRIERGTTIR